MRVIIAEEAQEDTSSGPRSLKVEEPDASEVVFAGFE
jgi:hypothetical protein